MSAAGSLAEVLDALQATLLARRGADPKTSYVASLYARAPDAILKKIGEEAAETLIAAKTLTAPGADPVPARAELVHEIADLWFHVMVLMAAYDVGLDELSEELGRRAGRSGLEEKAARRTVS